MKGRGGRLDGESEEPQSGTPVRYVPPRVGGRGESPVCALPNVRRRLKEDLVRRFGHSSASCDSIDLGRAHAYEVVVYHVRGPVHAEAAIA
jgi:hypothetical protein